MGWGGILDRVLRLWCGWGDTRQGSHAVVWVQGEGVATRQISQAVVWVPGMGYQTESLGCSIGVCGGRYKSPQVVVWAWGRGTRQSSRAVE